MGRVSQNGQLICSPKDCPHAPCCSNFVFPRNLPSDIPETLTAYCSEKLKEVLSETYNNVVSKPLHKDTEAENWNGKR
jgi:hypothetical protein